MTDVDATVSGAPSSGAHSLRDPARLFPPDAAVRGVAADLYARVANAPIISPHGHVPAQLLADDLAFEDPAQLLISSDHYVLRVLHSAGVDLSELGLGDAAVSPREVWRTVAQNWHRFAGTASGYWLDDELAGILGVPVPLSAETSDAVFDAVQLRLNDPSFRPRALFRQFGIEFLATTDDPLDDLEYHRALAAVNLGGRVAPTFRPDRYLDPDGDDFIERVELLLASSGAANTTFAHYLQALEARREYFIASGAVSADHGVEEMYTVDLDAASAETLFQSVLNGSADASARRQFRGHMILQMARMSVDDGLVMTIHPGIARSHSSATARRFGTDTGHDIPVPTSFTHGVRPLLEKFGLEKDFHLILFTVDESTFSREIAPLAGFYPSVFIGAPWWFLDAPDAIGRFRSAVTETAGFYRGSGFIDDTRAFLSIPTRHDTARRADCAYLARLVVEGRVALPVAERITDDLVSAIPKTAFKL